MASAKMLSNGRARIYFRFGAAQLTQTVTVGDAREAERICSAIEETIRDIQRGRLEIPEGADPRAFIFSGGKLTRSVTEMAAEAARPKSLAEVFASYVDNLTANNKQATSLATEAIHRKHLARILGGKAPMAGIDVNAIQDYVKARMVDGVTRDTIEKELATFSIVWKWAHKRGHLPGPLSWGRKDLDLPKGRQKPPFQTWAQIERRVKVEKLSKADAAEAWEALYLDQDQTVECLRWVEAHARHPFLPAMFAFAAYTGARRSEIVRSRRSDWDFEGRIVTIQEKKADTSRQLTRRSVPIHPELALAMQGWFAVTPDCALTIVNAHGRPMRPMVATWHFRNIFRGSKWDVLHGWHTFRHSLASNMASRGIDQRLISEIMGHHTEEMARRYGHLLPDKKESALRGMFG